MGIYSPTVKGIYNIELNSNKWKPYITLAVPVDIVDKEEETSTTYLTGDFGVGTKFVINENFGLWTDHRASFGESLVYDGKIGLVVSLFK